MERPAYIIVTRRQIPQDNLKIKGTRWVKLTPEALEEQEKCAYVFKLLGMVDKIFNTRRHYRTSLYFGGIDLASNLDGCHACLMNEKDPRLPAVDLLKNSERSPV